MQLLGNASIRRAAACIFLVFLVSRGLGQPVPINIQRSNSQVLISWPSGLDMVQPQKRTNLSSGSWLDLGMATTATNVADAPGSGPAYYRLRFLAPAITGQPLGQTNSTGSNADFSVTAAGTAPLAYQWRKDNSPLPGKTGTALTLTNISAGDAGSYTVVVSNWIGGVTSAVALLVVTNPAARPAGIYMGTFAGESDNGGFGVMLRSNGTAYVVGYNTVQQEGVSVTNGFQVALDGTFTATTDQGGHLGGTFTPTVVSGGFTNSSGAPGSYSGSRKADTGIHTADLGYYVGAYTGALSGDAYAVVAADGTVFFYSSGDTGDGGGYGAIDSANHFSAFEVSQGIQLTGTLNPATHVVSGSYSFAGSTLGTFSVTRTLTP